LEKGCAGRGGRLGGLVLSWEGGKVQGQGAVSDKKTGAVEGFMEVRKGNEDACVSVEKPLALEKKSAPGRIGCSYFRHDQQKF